MIPGRCRGGRWVLVANAVSFVALFAGTQLLAHGSAPWNPAAWAAPGTGDVVLVTAGLLFLGLGFLMPLHAGMINLGIHAQFLAGFSVAAAITEAQGVDPAARATLALLAGAATGAFTGSVMGWLKQRFAIHEILSGVLLGAALAPVAGSFSVVTSAAPTISFEPGVLAQSLRWAPGLGLVPRFVLASGILVLSLGLIAAVLFANYLRATVRGFDLRTVGSNPLAAVAAGVNVDRVQLATLTAGGACAGLTGALQLWTQPAVALERWPLPLAFAGVTVALYGWGSVGGLVAAAVLFAWWLNAPGTMTVLGTPGWGAAVTLLLILPAFWNIPRLFPDQGAPRSIWRPRDRGAY